jgi:hypothetical protein
LIVVLTYVALVGCIAGDVQLHEASTKGDVEAVRVLLARSDVNVNQRDEVRGREVQRGHSAAAWKAVGG